MFNVRRVFQNCTEALQDRSLVLTISGPKIRGSKISNPAVDIHDCVALGYAVKSVPEFRLRSFKG